MGFMRALAARRLRRGGLTVGGPIRRHRRRPRTAGGVAPTLWGALSCQDRIPLQRGKGRASSGRLRVVGPHAPVVRRE